MYIVHALSVCIFVTHCERQPGSESVYCCCIHSVHENEEVGRFVVGGEAVRVVGHPAVEVGVVLELEVVVLES